MSGQIRRNLYVTSGAMAALLLWTAACGGTRTAEEAAAGDAARADSARAPGTSVVALLDLPIRSAPDLSAASIRDVTAGTGLALVPPADDGEPPPAGWVQVSTWDDRRGWVPAADLLDIALWGHYQAALGGTPPTALRPAYPAPGGGWIVEAPFHSPGISTIATIWLAADTLFQTRVAVIESLDNECSGDRYRFARLASGPDAAAGQGAPNLDATVLAIASVERPTLKPLPVRPLDAPDADLDVAVAGAVERLLAAAPPGSTPIVTWQAIGDGAAWVTLTWEPAAETIEGGRWAAALLVRRGPAGEPPNIQTAIPLSWTSVGESSGPFDVRGAYSTGPGLQPTLFVVHSLHYEGLNVNVYLADADALRRVHLGYYWGC
ncbi:MAG: SH3 domain-containing protein [Gemmatimonadota bacterium]